MSSVTQSVSRRRVLRPCACVAPNDDDDDNYIFYAWRAPATESDGPRSIHHDATVYIFVIKKTGAARSAAVHRLGYALYNNKTCI